jgi:hypothetical protein
MMSSTSEAAAYSSSWRLRLEESSLRPGWAGLGIALAWLLFIAIAHTVASPCADRRADR